MSNMLTDVSLLTTIPEKTIEKFMQKFIYCICETVKEDALAGKEMSELDIGFAKLYIKYDANGIRYKFVPCAELENKLVRTLTTKENAMENFLNEALVKKFMDTYKDLC